MIWLTIGNVAIDEVGANDPTGEQPAAPTPRSAIRPATATSTAGDPSGASR